MILVTGGAGYIGSHTIIELINSDKQVIVLDNLENSSRESLRRVEQICETNIPFIKGDIRDSILLDKIFQEHPIDSVIHFAGLKSVGESVSFPLNYYDVNFSGTIGLLNAMLRNNVCNFIFSSSATVYGEPKEVPISETAYTGSTSNPYGTSKYMVEVALRDFCKANPKFSAISLRYFNPVGAHESGLLGEDPRGLPNNLVPFISQVAVGRLSMLKVFGDDYPTPDGTGVRDYIHVVDLAKGHVAAESKANTLKGFHAINLGTGKGYSVLEVIRTFEEVSKSKVTYEIESRRAGDIASCYADPSLARDLLCWEAKSDLSKMLLDSWNWQVNNPNGFE